MPTFQLTLAHDVSVYGTVEVEAENYAAAVEVARADLDSSGAIWGDITDVEWGSSYGFRVVDIYSIGDNGMDQMPLRKNIDLTGLDDCEPYSAEQVLASVTAARITT
jgi:hypothetical protein